MAYKTASSVVLALGALILLVSLTADITGLGDQVAFGPVQTTGMVAGFIVVGIGVFLYRKSSSGIQSDD